MVNYAAAVSGDGREYNKYPTMPALIFAELRRQLGG